MTLPSGKWSYWWEILFHPTWQGTYPLQGIYPTNVYFSLECFCWGKGLKVETLRFGLGSMTVILTTTTATVINMMTSRPNTMAISSWEVDNWHFCRKINQIFIFVYFSFMRFFDGCFLIFNFFQSFLFLWRWLALKS